jgi:hypothetical protein
MDASNFAIWAFCGPNSAPHLAHADYDDGLRDDGRALAGLDRDDLAALMRTSAHPIRRVTRAVLGVIPLCLALAACGGTDDSEPDSGVPRPEPTTQRSTSPPPSPDAGIAEGHAEADARRRRCRVARPPRFWRHCARIAR